MKKKITRIDDWMKANGLIEGFERAAIREGNFSTENWEDDFAAMRAKIAQSISSKAKRKEPLQKQLIGTFVFIQVTPKQGRGYFGRDIFMRLVLHESQNNATDSMA